MSRIAEEGGRVAVLPLRGSDYEPVLRRQQVVRIDERAGERILVPVTESGDALGVIDLHLPWPADERVLADIAAVAEALARVGRLLGRPHVGAHEAQAATIFARLGVVVTPVVPLPDASS